jgi:hypothetical protein
MVSAMSSEELASEIEPKCVVVFRCLAAVRLYDPHPGHQQDPIASVIECYGTS